MKARSVPTETAGSGELIVVVDDLADNVALLDEILSNGGYRVASAYNGPDALALIRAEPPDLILLDVNMPGMNGYTVCKQIKHDPDLSHIPVALLTTSKTTDRLIGLQAGADELISKPIERIELMIRVRALVRMKRQHDELDRSQQVLISVALALEARDPYTRMHSLQVASYARRLAAHLGFGKDVEQQIEQAGLLHDIGKIGVPDAILIKPGPLTDAEKAIMDTHPALGHEICRPLASLAHALGAIRHHHERWDGQGYPDRLTGETIPLMARVMAVADAYDAMTSDRPYRPGFSSERAQAILRAGAGSQWDARLIDAFLEMLSLARAAGDERPRQHVSTSAGDGRHHLTSGSQPG